MKGASSNGATLQPHVTRIKIPDFEVSCVAMNSFGPGFAIGADDGRLQCTDEEGRLLLDMIGSLSGEAINGIASYGRSMAVSTRHEVTLRTWPQEQLRHFDVLVAPHGAHGISATQSGYYVAPLGETGILWMKADAGADEPPQVMTTAKAGMYIYRVVAQTCQPGQDLLLCAARKSGLGLLAVQWGDSTCQMRHATFPELDVVDVCFVGGSSAAPVVAGVGRDGVLILAPDLLHDVAPLLLKFAAVQGRAYRLLSAGGHLFLLTSSALYVLLNLGTRLLQGLPSGKFTTPIFAMPLEAVDASLIGDRWLLIVLPDEVLRLDLKQMFANAPGYRSEGESSAPPLPLLEETATTVEERWEFENIQTGTRDLAGIV